jgi:hypothetical protein
MTDQYVEAAGQDRFDTAVRLTLRLRSENPAVPLEDHAARAALETFCMCVTGAEDAMESQLSSLHAGLTAEIVRRAEEELKDPVATAKSAADLRRELPARRGPVADQAQLREAARRGLIDEIDRASDASFPASDPPAWLNR